jgi:hypothetical protein
MIAWIKKLLWDETAFERFGRALLFAIGQAMQQGLLPVEVGTTGWYIGILLQISAFTVGAGDKNKPGA